MMMLDDVDLTLILCSLVLILYSFLLTPAVTSFMAVMVMAAYVVHHGQGGHHGRPRNPH